MKTTQVPRNSRDAFKTVRGDAPSVPLPRHPKTRRRLEAEIAKRFQSEVVESLARGGRGLIVM